MKYGMDITLQEILRIRPRAIDALEDAAGTDCWSAMDGTLREFASSHGKDPETLLHIIANLPVDPHGTPWAEKPLSRLLDRLTVDHQRFRGIDLPDLEALLFRSDASEFPPGYPLESIRNAFHAFKIDFLLHMEEEESFLYPHILRAEACLRHPDLSSEIFRGSVSAFGTTLLRTPEAEIKDLAKRLDALAGDFPRGGEPGKADAVDTRVKDLVRILTAHADLETGALVPATLQIERALTARRAA
jgi:iron-sulfur cluster repair protein YtfE (RIC family)